jgi:hypothetical protein
VLARPRRVYYSAVFEIESRLRLRGRMRKSLGAVTLWLMVLATPVELTAGDAKPEQASENDSAVGLVHLVSIAEADYFHANGRYATLSELINSGQLRRTAVHSPENLPFYRTVNSQSDSEPVAGYIVASVVGADSSTYKMSLTRKTDKCGMVVSTDESGHLYEGKPVACVTEEATSSPLSSPRDWAPPDVDDAIPPVSTDTLCPLPQLLHDASDRVQELADNLQRFSAKERIGDADIDRNGKSHNERSSVFDYVAEIRRDDLGNTFVEEYRSGGSATGPSLGLADTGTAAFALIFHPRHIEQFAMQCEGLTNLGTRPVWQLHFAQRPDRVNDFHAFRVKGNLYRVNLKGRAWIAADNYEVVRLETDLIEPIKEIELQVEHLVIDYGPVQFHKRNLQLWLPGSAALYVDYHGHRYQRRRDFSDFQLFWVETEQQVKTAHQSRPSRDN